MFLYFQKNTMLFKKNYKSKNYIKSKSYKILKIWLNKNYKLY